MQKRKLGRSNLEVSAIGLGSDCAGVSPVNTRSSRRRRCNRTERCLAFTYVPCGLGSCGA